MRAVRSGWYDTYLTRGARSLFCGACPTRSCPAVEQASAMRLTGSPIAARSTGRAAVRTWSLALQAQGDGKASRGSLQEEQHEPPVAPPFRGGADRCRGLRIHAFLSRAKEFSNAVN